MFVLYAFCSFLAGFYLGSSFDSQAYVAAMHGHTITLEQGLHSMPLDWWDGNFKKAAAFHCGDYDILEKTTKPSSLPEAAIKADTQYWVIRCK